MNELLNIRTTAVVTSLVSVMLAVCMLYVYNTRKTYPGFSAWTLSYVCLGAGMLMLGLRTFVPDWMSIVLANTISMCHLSLLCHGLERFYERPRHAWLNLVPPVLVLLSFSYYSEVVADLAQRIVIVSALAGVLCFRVAWLSLNGGAGRPGSASWPLALITAGYGVLVLARAAFTALLGVSGQNFMVQGWGHGLAISLSGLVGTAMIAALIGLNSQRLEDDLTRATREAKVLQGFLPICAQCKRIRDDDGYWNNLESYLSQHSEAEMSEGLCPDCLAELEGGRKMEKSQAVLVT